MMPESPKRGIKFTREKGEMELLREENIKIRDAFFMSLIKDDPNYVEVMKTLSGSGKPAAAKKPRAKKNTGRDPSVSYRTVIPAVRRRSARLQNKQPDTVDTEAVDNERQLQSDCDYDDLEDIVYQPKRPRMATKPSTHRVVPVEEINASMLANIAKRASEKIWSQNGTSCHQCRQKTLDQKTYCRNTECVGVRGQLCGPCIKNRYGEDAAVALMDPNWHCTVCRNICNCSFCRTKAGKRPTGILTPMAHQSGHKSVKDFLDSLRGKGDYADQDEKADNDVSCEEGVSQDTGLLGFSADGSVAHMGDEAQPTYKNVLNLVKLEVIIKDEEAKLSVLEKKHDESQNVLGFVKNSNIGLLENNTRFELLSLSSPCKAVHCKGHIKVEAQSTEEAELKTEMKRSTLQST